ncbi:MAG: PilZ domain-containing protein [Planctomycetes bacterium]|nr:PilZ domain-containing protein [Planctomycetota bacterium]
MRLAVERRCEVRERAHHLASVSANGWTSLGRTLDLSPRGLCVELSEEFPSCPFVDVSLGQKNWISTVRARVVRRQRTSRGRLGLGLALVEASASLVVQASVKSIRRQGLEHVFKTWEGSLDADFAAQKLLAVTWLALIYGAAEGD